MKWVGIILPFLAAIAAAVLMPLPIWLSLSNGLLAFFGLLVAALVQIIPVTANFLQADELDPVEAEKITKALERQQSYWLGLLSVTIITVVLIVFASAISIDLRLDLPRIGEFDPHIASGAIAFFATFVLTRMYHFVVGVRSLQRLRSQLVIQAAQKRMQERLRAEDAKTKPFKVPDGYGRVAQR